MELYDFYKTIYPHALAKAFVDPFDYALKLKGEPLTIHFQSATLLNSEWIRLNGVITEGMPAPRKPRMSEPRNGLDPIRHDRGMEIRVADILWISDAPYDS